MKPHNNLAKVFTDICSRMIKKQFIFNSCADMAGNGADSYFVIEKIMDKLTVSSSDSNETKELKQHLSKKLEERIIQNVYRNPESPYAAAMGI